MAKAYFKFDFQNNLSGIIGCACGILQIPNIPSYVRNELN
jgi:hypothetical protein